MTIDFAARRACLRRLASTGVLAEGGPYDTLARWQRSGAAARARRLVLWNEIIDEVLARYPDAARTGRVMVLGGLSGAGKSTLRRTQAAAWRLPEGSAVVIDPDECRELLVGRLRDRGELPIVREADGLDPPLTPLELAPAVHAEASQIALRLEEEVRRRGLDAILDTTMSNPDKVARRIAVFRRAGYSKVEVAFVDISPELARQSIEDRWRKGLERFVASGGRGLGGRYVASDLIEAQRHPVYASANYAAYLRLRGEAVFDEEHLYRRGERLELVASTNPILAYGAGMEPMRRTRRRPLWRATRRLPARGRGPRMSWVAFPAKDGEEVRMASAHGW